MSFQVIRSENVFTGRAFTIRRDTLRLPDDRQTALDIVDHVGSVVILPIDDQGRLLFVRQYRHATGQHLLELPAGTLNEGEDPGECARREIREETGMAAGEMRLLGGFYLAPGYSTEWMEVYLATALTSSPLAPDEDEFLKVEAVPLKEAVEMPGRGLLPDAKSLAAMWLARPWLVEHGYLER